MDICLYLLLFIYLLFIIIKGRHLYQFPFEFVENEGNTPSVQKFKSTHAFSYANSAFLNFVFRFLSIPFSS